MAYYNTCPNCGGNLDPGERCDCTPITIKLSRDDTHSIRQAALAMEALGELCEGDHAMVQRISYKKKTLDKLVNAAEGGQ